MGKKGEYGKEKETIGKGKRTREKQGDRGEEKESKGTEMVAQRTRKI